MFLGKALLWRRGFALVVASALTLLLTSIVPVGAHGPTSPGSSGTSEGSHTENPREGIEEIGFHPLHGTGFNTDIWAWVSSGDGGLYATSGTWGTLSTNPMDAAGCPSTNDNPFDPQESGVKIINATDPATPELVSVIGTFPGSQNNDPKVAHIEIPGGFSGDILSHSREPCGAELVLFGLVPIIEDIPNQATGFHLYDVTDPANPQPLGDFQNGGIGTHNHFIFPRPDLERAFVAAVWNESPVLFQTRGEAQFVEITDPNDPTLVSSWALEDAEAQGGPTFEELCHERGTHIPSCILHDIWTNDEGTIAYLSYWDAGLILLDITDPENPDFIGQIQEQAQMPDDPEGWLNEEGNTHAAVPLFVGDRHLVIVGDEDFVGPGPLPHVVIDAAPEDEEVDTGEQFLGTQMSNTARIPEEGVGPYPALLADDEYGCVWASAAAIGNTLEGWIGVARRGGTCATFQAKVTAAENAGADGLIIVNDGPGSVSGLAASATMPAMSIPGLFDEEDNPREGERLIMSIDNTAHDVEVSMQLIEPVEPDVWGFMRVVDATSADDADWRELSQFRAPHVDTADQPADSVFSAHNPIVGPDGRVYFAWYSDGLRVLEVAADGTVNERAWFVPLPEDHPDDPEGDPHGVQEAHFGFWGSIPICDPSTGDLLIFNSDFNRGIYILRATYDDCGEPAPPPPGDGAPEPEPPPPGDGPPDAEPPPPPRRPLPNTAMSPTD